ncbi:hypothetical protein BDZ94DRAFT_1272715 [Collybia nuda]|uniref:Uncharacterized protein n=1 Tax=Collybia nuda TaxID=64659 RepID=A0A9P5XXS1_9AGAR|nr:hypothetical protein BDZ94DRAFT_1272715 [Collybia nuda]
MGIWKCVTCFILGLILSPDGSVDVNFESQGISWLRRLMSERRWVINDYGFVGKKHEVYLGPIIFLEGGLDASTSTHMVCSRTQLRR